MTTYDHIDVHPISGSLGAEISGVDFSRSPPDEVMVEVRRAWLDHLVIFFRDQTLTPNQLLGAAQLFGRPVEYPFVAGLDDHPEITPVVKLEHEVVNFGGLWHSDTAYQRRPPMGTMLYALEVPAVGGDTLFANCYQAYETLSDGLRATLEHLIGVNVSDRSDTAATRAPRVADNPGVESTQPRSAEHPVVRVHAETGRRSLYVNGAHTSHFTGWSTEESRPLLEYLFAHQIRPEFTCRFRWEPGSLALWDNRCTLHNPINDYHGHRRVMHRVTLAGGG